jgi:hypothetical protein
MPLKDLQCSRKKLLSHQAVESRNHYSKPEPTRAFFCARFFHTLWLQWQYEHIEQMQCAS